MCWSSRTNLATGTWGTRWPCRHLNHALPTIRPVAMTSQHSTIDTAEQRSTNDLSYPRYMTERVEFDVDEITAAYLRRCAHQRGVSIGAAAAGQLRELALVDAARALAAWDPAGAYAQAQTEERESAAAS